MLSVDVKLLTKQSDLLAGFHDEAHESGRKREENLIDGLQNLLAEIIVRLSEDETVTLRAKRR